MKLLLTASKGTKVATVLTACGIETATGYLIKPGDKVVATVLTACGIETDP